MRRVIDWSSEELSIQQQPAYVVQQIEAFLFPLVVGEEIFAVSEGMIPAAVLIFIIFYRRYQRCTLGVDRGSVPLPGTEIGLDVLRVSDIHTYIYSFFSLFFFSRQLGAKFNLCIHRLLMARRILAVHCWYWGERCLKLHQRRPLFLHLPCSPRPERWIKRREICFRF